MLKRKVKNIYDLSQFQWSEFLVNRQICAKNNTSMFIQFEAFAE